MRPDRWDQINSLYHAALEVAEQQRGSFLKEACQGDTELRSEVESLLAVHKEAGGFLGKPAMEEVAQVLKEEPPSWVGRQLGPFQILGLLGAGGMGEVYRARDSRLNRTVAIKVLPRYLLERSDLRQRFEREARAIASLDHPHICALYDIGREGATDFLVMQYLEGETLSQRLKREPLSTEEVLRHAIEIAGALEKAHRRGMIHRDLKPGNIMLTETGAKLLDFGLAKQNRPPLTRGDFRGVESATQSESLTEQGMLLGTLEYMAPEQLEGKEADARTDIFALGVVIYEMATGRKAFEGDSKASVIAKILTSQPAPIPSIQPVSPPELDALVQKCLAKKSEERWQTAVAVTTELHEITGTVLPTITAQKRGTEPWAIVKGAAAEAKHTIPAAVPEAKEILSGWRRYRPGKLGLVGVLFAIVVASVITWRVVRRPEARPKEMSFKPLTSYAWDNQVEHAAISPDGKYLAFCVRGGLYIQVIRTGEKRSLNLPEGFHVERIAWFPDGTKLLLGRFESRWVGVKGQRSLRWDMSSWSLSILGGAPQKIVDSACDFSVSPDGSMIAFTRTDDELEKNDLWLVNSNGESPRRIRSQPGIGYYNPTWSSDGRRLFYSRDLGSGRSIQSLFYSLDFGNGRSIESCDLSGEHVTNIYSGIEAWTGLFDLCWAPDGRLLFTQGKQGIGFRWIFDLWEIKVDVATGRPLDQAQKLTQLSSFSSLSTGELSITADGKRLVMLKWSSQGDIFVSETDAGGKSIRNPRRLTLDETDDIVTDWTADSEAVLFSSPRNGNMDIFKQKINEVEAEAIVATPELEGNPNLSPDGAFILYLDSTSVGPAKRLMRIPVGGGPPEQVLSGEKINNFSCAREAKLCVVVEEVEGKQVLTTFDLLKGRGAKLPSLDYPDLGRGILSPQGRLIEKMIAGPEGLHLRARSLNGGPLQEVTFKNFTGDYQFKGWSRDGRGIYLLEETPSGVYTTYYANLDGHSQVLWKRGTSPGRYIDNVVPSPDGRHLAFTSVICESNAWLVENF